MMESWLDLFRRTRREYFADFFITPPITIVLLIVSVRTSLSVMWPIKFALGLLLWTLYEYATHRWVAHRVFLFREAHALHHRDQIDYIALHPAATIAIYILIAAIFGIGSSAITVGFSVGYIAYSCLHTAFHYAPIYYGHRLYRLKLRHAAHHRADVNFGVSTSLWDRVFCTEDRA